MTKVGQVNLVHGNTRSQSLANSIVAKSTNILVLGEQILLNRLVNHKRVRLFASIAILQQQLLDDRYHVIHNSIKVHSLFSFSFLYTCL